MAVGFLRMGPWELTAMEVAKVARQKFLDDVTDSVGQVFLAHALQCARCHDHKFDPVPTRDYYGFQAVFATTQIAERPASFLPVENTSGFDERAISSAGRDHLRGDPQADRQQGRGRGAKVVHRAAICRTCRAVKGLRDNDPREPVAAQVDRTGTPRPRHPTDREQGTGTAHVGAERYRPFALSVYSGRTPDMKRRVAPRRMPDNRMDRGRARTQLDPARRRPVLAQGSGDARAC